MITFILPVLNSGLGTPFVLRLLFSVGLRNALGVYVLGALVPSSCPYKAEVRGSSPRGPTISISYVKFLSRGTGSLLSCLCSGGVPRVGCMSLRSFVSYDIVSLLSYDSFHSLHSTLETMKSPVIFGSTPHRRAEVRVGCSPAWWALVRGERFLSSLLLWGWLPWWC